MACLIGKPQLFPPLTMVHVLLWVELQPPKRSVEVLTPATSECDLICKQDLRRCNQVKMRSDWLLGGPKPDDWCPYEKATWRHQEDAMGWHRQRLQWCSRKPREDKICQQLQQPGERRGTDPPSEPPEGTNPVTPWLPTSNLQNCERINFCCF